MADMACHHVDLPFWALDLKHPTKVSATGAPVTAEHGAGWIVSEFEFPARGDNPPVTLTWYDGDKRPRYFAEKKLPKWGDGTLFVGARKPRAQKGRSTWWQAMSASVPPPKSHQPRQLKGW